MWVNVFSFNIFISHRENNRLFEKNYPNFCHDDAVNALMLSTCAKFQQKSAFPNLIVNANYIRGGGDPEGRCMPLQLVRQEALGSGPVLQLEQSGAVALAMRTSVQCLRVSRQSQLAVPGTTPPSPLTSACSSSKVLAKHSPSNQVEIFFTASSTALGLI